MADSLAGGTAIFLPLGRECVNRGCGERRFFRGRPAAACGARRARGASATPESPIATLDASPCDAVSQARNSSPQQGVHEIGMLLTDIQASQARFGAIPPILAHPRLTPPACGQRRSIASPAWMSVVPTRPADRAGSRQDCRPRGEAHAPARQEPYLKRSGGAVEGAPMPPRETDCAKVAWCTPSPRSSRAGA